MYNSIGQPHYTQLVNWTHPVNEAFINAIYTGSLLAWCQWWHWSHYWTIIHYLEKKHFPPGTVVKCDGWYRNITDISEFRTRHHIPCLGLSIVPPEFILRFLGWFWQSRLVWTSGCVWSSFLVWISSLVWISRLGWVLDMIRISIFSWGARFVLVSRSFSVQEFRVSLHALLLLW